MQTIFGVSKETLAKDALQQLARDIQTMLDAIPKRAMNPLWRYTPEPTLNKAMKRIDQFIAKLIASKRGDTGKAKDLLTLLLNAADDETGEKLSPEGIRDECLTFIMAGHETTAVTAVYLFYEMANNPDIQKKIQEEVDAQLQDRPPSSIDDLDSLKYAAATISETLRFHPPLALTARLPTTDMKVFNNEFTIPADINIVVPIMHIHRSEKYWPRAMKFDPARFMGENAKKIPPGAFLTFGGGSRICVGKYFVRNLELPIMLLMLLQKFSVEFADKKDFEEQCSMTVRPKGPFNLVFKKRQ